MKHFIYISFFLLLTISGQAQTWIKGKVQHAETQKAISGAYIRVGSFASTSNAKGEFFLAVGGEHVHDELRVTHIAFFEQRQPFRMDLADTIEVLILMKPKVYQLVPTEVAADRKPEPVFHSNFHYVHDFELVNDQLLMITFNRSLKKDPELTLSSLNTEILMERSIPKGPIGLHKDFAGRIFLEYERAAYWINLDSDSLDLVPVDLHDYVKSVKPCKDSLNDQILFSDQIWFLPRFNYYAFDIGDSMVFLLKDIVHKQVNHMMRWEYYDMDIDDQRRARKMAEHFPELDAQEMAGIMSGFQHTIFYEEPYAPLFVREDTIFLFDHHSDMLYRYSEKLESIDSIDISYHKPKKRRSWKRQMFYDEKNKAFYGLFVQNGYPYLKLIDTQTGGVAEVNKLQHQFVEKICVHGSFAYYLYKEPNSQERPYIFRELLSDAN